MLVTDKFVFLHIPRAGGNFVYEVVTKFFPSAREVGYHLPRELLPQEYAHLPILGTVRSPWDFYVSWYHYQKANAGYSPTKNALFCYVSNNRELDFDQTIRNALTLGVNDEKLDALLKTLPEDFDYEKRMIPNLTKDLMRRIRGTGWGLYTFRFNETFGDADDVYFCRVESLTRDLLNFFEEVGVANDALREHVLGLGKRNPSEHLNSENYFTKELAELVRVRDLSIVERFGFKFGNLTNS